MNLGKSPKYVFICMCMNRDTIIVLSISITQVLKTISSVQIYTIRI